MRVFGDWCVFFRGGCVGGNQLMFECLKTIELLYTLSTDLARMVFGNYLESIVTSTNLSLPLDTQTQTLGMEERMKVKMGRRETAGRALEVCEVVAHVQARVRPWPGGVGEKEGGSGNEEASVVNWGDVVSVLATLGEKEKEKDVEGDADGDGWEEGVKRVMDLVRLCEFQSSIPSP